MNLPESKKYTQAEMERLFSDVMDPTKVQVVCKAHMYIGKEAPPNARGCKDCWQAWWTYKIATTPAHLRQERLDSAYVMLRHANEAFERGEFDFEPLDRAIIEQTKEKD